jgi:hypothetical protein
MRGGFSLNTCGGKMKTLAGLISSLALASCVSAPPGTPDVSGMQMELRGHPLDAGDVVILHASNQWAAKQQLAAADADKAQPGHSIEPAADLELLRKSFVAGFSAVKSASPVSSEEKLAAACFSGAGLAEREPWAQPIQPDFSAPACRAALASARARYLVSVHGWLTTDSLTDVEVIGIGAGVTTELRYHFEVAAMVFDVRTGNAICGDQGWWEAKGVRGAGVFVTPYPFPVPIPLLCPLGPRPASWLRKSTFLLAIRADRHVLSEALAPSCRIHTLGPSSRRRRSSSASRLSTSYRPMSIRRERTRDASIAQPHGAPGLRRP